MAKPVSQLTTRGSAVTVCSFEEMPVTGSPHRRSRSLSLKDREKGLETCEIGEQGGLVVDRLTRQYASRWKTDLRLAPYLKDIKPSRCHIERLLTNSDLGEALARERVLRCRDGTAVEGK